MMYRLYKRPSAWNEMDRLRREMNRLFDTNYGSRYRAAPNFPALNIWSSQEGLLLTAEIPGVNLDDLDISVINETLTLSGDRIRESVDTDARYHRRERGHGKFTRTVQLPYKVESARVEATYKDGVLNVSLPRAEEDKPKKISVISA